MGWPTFITLILLAAAVRGLGGNAPMGSTCPQRISSNPRRCAVQTIIDAYLNQYPDRHSHPNPHRNSNTNSDLHSAANKYPLANVDASPCLRFPRNLWQNTDLSGHWIDIDLGAQMLYAYDGDTLIKSFLVSTGTAAHPTVTGTLQRVCEISLYRYVGTRILPAGCSVHHVFLFWIRHPRYLLAQ